MSSSAYKGSVGVFAEGDMKVYSGIKPLPLEASQESIIFVPTIV